MALFKPWKQHIQTTVTYIAQQKFNLLQGPQTGTPEKY